MAKGKYPHSKRVDVGLLLEIVGEKNI